MYSPIRRAALTWVALAIMCGASAAKEPNLQAPATGANPQMVPHKCEPPATGAWPNCATASAAARLCSWKENNGTPLGISGTCRAASASAIGSPCTCTRTVEHKKVVHHGAVIAAPQAGSPSVVR